MAALQHPSPLQRKDPIMSNARSRLLALLTALFLATTLSACGDTWRGVKEDTSDNLKSTGEALEKGGEKVEP
jgi:predicted small secreted protein